jgi:hypothetical protein
MSTFKSFDSGAIQPIPFSLRGSALRCSLAFAGVRRDPGEAFGGVRGTSANIGLSIMLVIPFGVTTLGRFCSGWNETLYKKSFIHKNLKIRNDESTTYVIFDAGHNGDHLGANGL